MSLCWETGLNWRPESLAWSIQFFEKVFVLIPFLCIFIPCCDRFASHGGLAIVGFDIFATIWNVDGNWNGFSGEELWGRIGV